MKYELGFRKEAFEDLQESYEWYNNRKEGLGSDFLKEVEDTLKLIQSNPFLYSAIHKDIRRALVKKFPYSIFYLVEANKIIVLAVFHMSRKPIDW